jgi:hypothetical protein
VTRRTVGNEAMYSGAVVVTDDDMVRAVLADSAITETVPDAVDFQSFVDGLGIIEPIQHKGY